MTSYNVNDTGRPVQFGEGQDIPVGQETIITDDGQEVQQDTQSKKPNKDRAKKRIQELASQKNAAVQEAANYKRMYEETVQRMQTETKTVNANLKTTLEQQYNSLLQQMGDAIRAGEADKVVQCQTAMMDTKIQLDKLNSAPAPESVPNRQRVEAETPVPKIPELARLWIEDHPNFNSDELFHNAAITVNNQLLREGYDVESEEFYEQLSARLTKRFPEAFGTPEESMVQYKGDETDDSAFIVKQPARPQVRTQEQTVSGPSRPSANTIRSSRSSSNQVTFSKQDSDMMNAWGLDQERIANRIKHNDANRQSDNPP